MSHSLPNSKRLTVTFALDLDGLDAGADAPGLEAMRAIVANLTDGVPEAAIRVVEPRRRGGPRPPRRVGVHTGRLHAYD